MKIINNCNRLLSFRHEKVSHAVLLNAVHHTMLKAIIGIRFSPYTLIQFTYRMPGKLRKGIFLRTVNFGVFVNLNIHKSLITVPRPSLYRKFAIFIFANGIIFAKFLKHFLCVIFPRYSIPCDYHSDQTHIVN